MQLMVEMPRLICVIGSVISATCHHSVECQKASSLSTYKGKHA